MYVVLCYDVSHNRRRARLFKRLKGFLRPVQESVFEGVLPERRWGDLLVTCSRSIDPESDALRIYTLCRACRGGTVLLGTSAAVPDSAEPVVV